MKDRKVRWKEKNLECVYIATSGGSNVSEWQENVIKHKLKGTHLFLNSYATTTLMVRLIGTADLPTYILFDENLRVFTNPFEVEEDPIY